MSKSPCRINLWCAIGMAEGGISFDELEMDWNLQILISSATCDTKKKHNLAQVIILVSFISISQFASDEVSSFPLVEPLCRGKWVKGRNEACCLFCNVLQMRPDCSCYLKGFYSFLPQGQLSFYTCIADPDSVSLYLLSIIYTAGWLRTVFRGVQFHCQSIDQKDFLLMLTDKAQAIYECKMEF